MGHCRPGLNSVYGSRIRAISADLGLYRGGNCAIKLIMHLAEIKFSNGRDFSSSMLKVSGRHNFVFVSFSSSRLVLGKFGSTQFATDAFRSMPESFWPG